MANDNIFQQYLSPPKSVMDYTAEMDQADARRNALQMSALGLQEGQMKLANAADVGSQRNALRAAVTSGQIDLSNPAHVNRALSIAPDVAPGLLKTVQESANGRALAAKNNADAGESTQKTAASEFELRIKKSDQAIKDIAGFNSPQEALASLQAHVASGDVDPAKAQMIQQGMPQDPAKFSDWKVGMIRNIMSAKEQMQYSTPDANTVANNDRVKVEGQANRANQIKVQGMIGDRQDKADAADVESPASIEKMAQGIASGRLAPMSSFAMLKPSGKAIMSRVLDINPTYDSGDYLSKNKALRDYGTGTQGMAIQAANTGLNHLDTIEQLATAQKNGNTRLFNTLANRLAAETGSAAPTNLAAAISMVAPEVSKMVIGAAGGQEERATFARNFNPNASPDQTLGGIKTMRELLGGRLSEAERTYKRATGREDFSSGMLSPAAQKVLSARTPATNASATAPAGKPSLSDIFGK